MIRWSLRRWSSPGNPHLQAAELLPSPGNGDAMAVALSRITTDLTGAAFLVVRIDGIQASAVAQAVESFYRGGGNTRLCLAGGRATLGVIDAASIDCDRTGLLLDEVDVDTPLSDLVWDRIEAVRFRPDFVAKAARHLRTGCALDAMLSLANDVGLCTFGFDVMPDGTSVTGRATFDYLPLAASTPVRRSVGHARARREAVTLAR